MFLGAWRLGSHFAKLGLHRIPTPGATLKPRTAPEPVSCLDQAWAQPLADWVEAMASGGKVEGAMELKATKCALSGAGQ